MISFDRKTIKSILAYESKEVKKAETSCFDYIKVDGNKDEDFKTTE